MNIEEIRKRHEAVNSAFRKRGYNYEPPAQGWDTQAHQDRAVLLDRIAELERRLDAVAELPGKWRLNHDGSHIHEGYPATNEKCASDIEHALSGKEVGDGN